MAEKGRNLEVTQVIEGYDRYQDNFLQIDHALSLYPDIGGIYMATGHIGACMDAIKQKREGTKNPRGLQRYPAGGRAGNAGRNHRVHYVQNPYQQGYSSLRILYEYIFKGKSPECEYIFSETHIKILESL